MKRFLQYAFTVSWILFVIGAYFLEPNREFTQNHSFKQEIFNSGIFTATSDCFSSSIKQTPDQALKLRESHAYYCAALAHSVEHFTNQFGETKTKLKPIWTYPISLILLAGLISLFLRKKQKTNPPQAPLVKGGRKESFFSLTLTPFRVYLLLIGLILFLGSCYFYYFNPLVFNGNLEFDVLRLYQKSPNAQSVGILIFLKGLILNLAFISTALLVVVTTIYAIGERVLGIVLNKISPNPSLSRGESPVFAPLIRGTRHAPSGAAVGGFTLWNFSLASALGIGVLILLLYFTTWFGQLKTPVVWGEFIVLLALSYKQVWFFLRSFFTQKFDFNFKLFSFKSAALFVLGTFLALNILELIRPIPIGWDDMGVYLNWPRLMSQSHELIPGNGLYGWSLIMSLGFTLFNSATVGLLLSWLGGFFSLIVLYVLLKKAVSEYSVLPIILITLFYSLPAVFFQSAKDLKVDLGLFFLISSALLVFLEWVQTKKLVWLALCGFILGTAFTVKLTATLAILAILVILINQLFKKTGVITALLMFCVILLNKADLIAPYSNFTFFSALPHWLVYPFLVLIILSALFLIIRYKREFLIKVKLLLVFLLFILIPCLPWGIRHYLEVKSFNPATLINGTFHAPGLNLEQAKNNFQAETGSNDTAFPQSKDVPSLTAPLTEKIIPSAPQAIGNAFREEMGRYFGYEKGILAYLLLSWKITMNTTTYGFYVDIGFVFLALLVGLLIFIKPRPLSLEWKIVIGFTVIYWIGWTFLANGVIWYGLPGFAGILLILRKLLEETFSHHRSIFNLALGMILLWFVLTFFVRFYAYYNPYALLYTGRLISSTEFIESNLPTYPQIYSYINSTPATPENPNYVYRIGTFITYFIEDNLNRVINDAQLDQFTYLYSEHNQNLTNQRLKYSGVRFLVVDLNTATIDQTPDKTLTQKFHNLLEYLNANPGLNVIVNNQKLGILFAEIK
ncbi:hypothetical protein AUJ78_00680 [Candidatus Peregrinibacteria bacterium CG1_02_41_10]|nr:MAG: hypothetical protein AUJ78_00680 [Candidatus Peregrinibacteria bacterium CG1_02_41_10]